MNKQCFTATSNYDFAGQPPARSGRPADSQEFTTEAAARRWLAARGGGAVSFFDPERGDFRSIDVPAGGAA